MAKENTLIYRAQTGDEGAFAELMRAYHAYVYAIVIGIVKNSHDAEEVVQDTFLSAYRGLTQLEDRKKFKSWLAEIARNRARNWLRKQRGDTVSINGVSEHLLQTEDSPDERLTRLEQRELIRRTMETLPQKDRDIARAFYLEGASYKELTNAHGLSDKAISFRLSRARRQLSKRLQYLLTGIFVSPAMILKRIYSGGLTAMKVGTVPKITVGAAALIALIFIGFVGIRQMNAPIVEERVYLSPWEDGTVRPQNNPEGFPTDTTQDAENGGTQPQIATAESAAGMESIDDFFGQPEETDTAEFAAEAEFEPETDQSLTTDTSASSENTNQSAEDVMDAYVDAWRNSDFEAMHPLFAEDIGHSGLSETTVVGVETVGGHPDGEHLDVEDIEEKTRQIEQLLNQLSRKRRSQVEVVSNEYVGDEFHFRFRTPASEIPDISDQGETVVFPSEERLVKMRKENGAWRIYDSMFDVDSAKSELSEMFHR